MSDPQSIGEQASGEQWLEFMRQQPWYRERDGAPLCMVEDCEEHCAWVLPRGDGEVMYVAGFASGSLPLNMCVAHRWAQKSREPKSEERDVSGNAYRFSLETDYDRRLRTTAIAIMVEMRKGGRPVTRDEAYSMAAARLKASAPVGGG